MAMGVGSVGRGVGEVVVVVVVWGRGVIWTEFGIGLEGRVEEGNVVGCF